MHKVHKTISTQFIHRRQNLLELKWFFVSGEHRLRFKQSADVSRIDVRRHTESRASLRPVARLTTPLSGAKHRQLLRARDAMMSVRHVRKHVADCGVTVEIEWCSYIPFVTDEWFIMERWWMILTGNTEVLGGKQSHCHDKSQTDLFKVKANGIHSYHCPLQSLSLLILQKEEA
jgi:hypothetical protein